MGGVYLGIWSPSWVCIERRCHNKNIYRYFSHWTYWAGSKEGVIGVSNKNRHNHQGHLSLHGFFVKLHSLEQHGQSLISERPISTLVFLCPSTSISSDILSLGTGFRGRQEDRKINQLSWAYQLTYRVGLIHLFHSHLGGFKRTHRTEIREPYGS